MLSAISISTPPDVPVQATAATPPPQTQTQPTPVAKPQPVTHTSDTVTISSAALAMQEASEGPAQTAKEAAAGDHQALRMLARQAAARASS